jgi:hypothetical protein
MIEGNPSPLRGDSVRALKVSTSELYGGKRTLANRWRASERGIFDRVDTGPDPRYPGIRRVWLYPAEYDFSVGQPVSLEAAWTVGEKPESALFLLSRVGVRTLVATSMVGYDESGPVQIREQKSIGPSLEIDLVDYSWGTDESTLLVHHTARLGELGGNPEEEFPSVDADQAFRYLMSSCEEVF